MSQISQIGIIEKNVKSELNSLVNELVDDYDLYNIEYEIVINEEQKEINIEIDIYTDKYMEISEYCNVSIDDVVNVYDIEIPEVEYVEDINDPELRERIEKLIDQLHNDCVDEVLNEVNERALRSDLSIESDLIDVSSMPLLCDGDYCKVGGKLMIRIKSLDYADIQYSLHILKNIMKLWLELR